MSSSARTLLVAGLACKRMLPCSDLLTCQCFTNEDVCSSMRLHKQQLVLPSPWDLLVVEKAEGRILNNSARYFE